MRIPNSNYRQDGQTFYLVSGADEPFDPTDVLYAQAALDDHDHTEGRGRAVGRLAGGIVGAAAVRDGAITTPKLAPGAVGSSQMGAGAVGLSALAPGAVAAALGRDGGLTAQYYAARSISGRAFVLGTLTADLFAAGVLPVNELGAGSITSAKLADGAVTPEKLADGAASGSKLGPVPACRYLAPNYVFRVEVGGWSHRISLADAAWAVDNTVGDEWGIWRGPSNPSRFRPPIVGTYLISAGLAFYPAFQPSLEIGLGLQAFPTLIQPDFALVENLGAWGGRAVSVNFATTLRLDGQHDLEFSATVWGEVDEPGEQFRFVDLGIAGGSIEVTWVAP